MYVQQQTRGKELQLLRGSKNKEKQVIINLRKNYKNEYISNTFSIIF